jgi:hypothetical protein
MLTFVSLATGNVVPVRRFQTSPVFSFLYSDYAMVVARVESVVLHIPLLVTHFRA